MELDIKYDIALSFAGEDRPYVKEVAEILKASNVKLFYDEFEESELWGKNLYTYLGEVYKDHAKYTVMFCSEHYNKKLWTNHERENAQERAFREHSEYILPAKLDDTEIPGLKSTIAYIDLRKKTPYELCELICKKLKADIIKKELLNKKLHKAVEQVFKEEENLSIRELESRNERWDLFQNHINSLNPDELFEHQKVNSLHHLKKFGVPLKEIKKHLKILGYYDGVTDDDFTHDLVKAITIFQRLSNMRHIDGIIAELTLKEIETKLNNRHSRRA